MSILHNAVFHQKLMLKNYQVWFLYIFQTGPDTLIQVEKHLGIFILLYKLLRYVHVFIEILNYKIKIF